MNETTAKMTTCEKCHQYLLSEEKECSNCGYPVYGDEQMRLQYILGLRDFIEHLEKVKMFRYIALFFGSYFLLKTLVLYLLYTMSIMNIDYTFITFIISVLYLFIYVFWLKNKPMIFMIFLTVFYLFHTTFELEYGMNLEFMYFISFSGSGEFEPTTGLVDLVIKTYPILRYVISLLFLKGLYHHSRLCQKRYYFKVIPHQNII